ncbi:MAG: tetratricopeptide repeat protein [Pseudomonadota bacterium]
MRYFIIFVALIFQTPVLSNAQSDVDDDPLTKAFDLLFAEGSDTVLPLSEEYESALELVQREAAAGDGYALNAMGVIHANGILGFKQDLTKAETAYRSAVNAEETRQSVFAYMNLAETLSSQAETGTPSWDEVGEFAEIAYDLDPEFPGAATLFGMSEILGTEFAAPMPEAERLLLEGVLTAPNDMRQIWLLARGYENGWFGDPDATAACDYYETASKAAMTDAYWKTGMCYLEGSGVPKDDATAFKWVSKSAEAGDQSGLISHGVMLATGQGTEIDSLAAAEAYRRAAMLDGPLAAHAMRSLGYMQVSGELPETGRPAYGHALLTLADIGGDDLASQGLRLARERYPLSQDIIDQEIQAVREEFGIEW